MAITKIIVIRDRLDKRVSYALNENKTSLKNALEYTMDEDKTEGEQRLFESAINCDKETAFHDMMQTKKFFGKTDKVQGYHIIQSFKPDEITPELAHQIGVEFAQKCFNQYESVVGTHLDKNHLHNHVVVNSVSLIDGRKYRNNFKDYFGDIRGISDALCTEHGLSLIEDNEQRRSVTYVEWLARNKGKTSWQTIIRNDVDDCIKQAFSFGNFIMLMEYKGYEVKKGKYISFRPFGGEYFFRGYKLGNAYSFENIWNRILGKDLSADLKDLHTQLERKREFTPYPKVKKGSFKALLLHYQYLMGIIKRNEAPDRASSVLKTDLLLFDKMTRTFDFVHEKNVETIEQVMSYKEQCYQKISHLKREKLDLQAEKEKLSPAFEALRMINVYDKPYRLYLKGYHEMEEEHDAYLKAKDLLKTWGYEAPEGVAFLVKTKSDMEDRIFTNDTEIRSLKKDIQSCNYALELNNHIVEKMHRLEELDEHDGEMKHTTKEIVQSMLER